VGICQFARDPRATWSIIQADVQKDSFVAALDIETGKEIWRTPRNDVPTFGSPAVVPYTAGGAKSGRWW
jgi:outer membrane protein assembly factor BamB